MASVLVLSGATTAADWPAAGCRPDYVIDGIGQLLPDAAASQPADGSPQ